jgi:hypothetical protein
MFVPPLASLCHLLAIPMRPSISSSSSRVLTPRTISPYRSAAYTRICRRILKTYNAGANTSRIKLCSTSRATEAACLRKSVGATHRNITTVAVGRITRDTPVYRTPRQVAERRRSRALRDDRWSILVAAVTCRHSSYYFSLRRWLFLILARVARHIVSWDVGWGALVGGWTFESKVPDADRRSLHEIDFLMAPISSIALAQQAKMSAKSEFQNASFSNQRTRRPAPIADLLQSHEHWNGCSAAYQPTKRLANDSS